METGVERNQSTRLERNPSSRLEEDLGTGVGEGGNSWRALFGQGSSW